MHRIIMSAIHVSKIFIPQFDDNTHAHISKGVTIKFFAHTDRAITATVPF